MLRITLYNILKTQDCRAREFLYIGTVLEKVVAVKMAVRIIEKYGVWWKIRVCPNNDVLK